MRTKVYYRTRMDRHHTPFARVLNGRTDISSTCPKKKVGQTKYCPSVRKKYCREIFHLKISYFRTLFPNGRTINNLTVRTFFSGRWMKCPFKTWTSEVQCPFRKKFRIIYIPYNERLKSLRILLIYCM